MVTVRKIMLLCSVLIFAFIFLTGCDSNESLNLELDANGGLFSNGTNSYHIQTDDLSTITLPTNPSKTGYTFEGWFWDDKTFNDSFSINSLSEKDLNDPLIIYAKWSEGIDEGNDLTSFTITFNTNGGSLMDPITIVEGTAITIPDIPEKSGYEFEGWYLDNTFNTPADSIFTMGVLEDITIYAKWSTLTPVKVTEGLLYTLKSDETYEVVGYTGNDLDIYIPEAYLGVAVTSIGRIESISEFNSLYLPSSINTIDESMFSYSSISHITVSDENMLYSSLDGVLFDKEIKMLIWFPLAKGESYTVPDGVERIGQGCFRDNRSISSVILPDSLISIEDKAFWGTTSLTSIVIPDNVISIGWNAFYVSGIENVTLGNSVETIARGAFSGTNISSITFPSSILSIGEEAFAVCKNLVSITIHATIPPKLGLDPFRNMVFGGYNESLKIYVPNNYVNDYKSAADWAIYVDIITNI